MYGQIRTSLGAARFPLIVPPIGIQKSSVTFVIRVKKLGAESIANGAQHGREDHGAARGPVVGVSVVVMQQRFGAVDEDGRGAAQGLGVQIILHYGSVSHHGQTGKVFGVECVLISPEESWEREGVEKKGVDFWT